MKARDQCTLLAKTCSTHRQDFVRLRRPRFQDKGCCYDCTPRGRRHVSGIQDQEAFEKKTRRVQASATASAVRAYKPHQRKIGLVGSTVVASSCRCYLKENKTRTGVFEPIISGIRDIQPAGITKTPIQPNSSRGCLSDSAAFVILSLQHFSSPDDE